MLSSTQWQGTVSAVLQAAPEQLTDSESESRMHCDARGSGNTLSENEREGADACFAASTTHAQFDDETSSGGLRLVFSQLPWRKR